MAGPLQNEPAQPSVAAVEIVVAGCPGPSLDNFLSISKDIVNSVLAYFYLMLLGGDVNTWKINTVGISIRPLIWTYLLVIQMSSTCWTGRISTYTSQGGRLWGIERAVVVVSNIKPVSFAFRLLVRLTISRKWDGNWNSKNLANLGAFWVLRGILEEEDNFVNSSLLSP